LKLGDDEKVRAGAVLRDRPTGLPENEELKQRNVELLFLLIRAICVIRGRERFICAICGWEGLIMVEVGVIRGYPWLISFKCAHLRPNDS
jgi:hypothetical protein